MTDMLAGQSLGWQQPGIQMCGGNHVCISNKQRCTVMSGKPTCGTLLADMILTFDFLALGETITTVFVAPSFKLNGKKTLYNRCSSVKHKYRI